MVAHSRRFLKNHMLAWERAEEIGNPFSAIYLSLMHPPFISPYWKTRKLSGHLVYTSLGSHTVDFILWFLKGKKRPVRVYSEGYSNIPDTEGMDEASLIIGFDDGALATTSISMNNQTPRIEKVIITGEKGTLHMEHRFLPSKRSGMVGDVHSNLAIDDRVIWDGVQEEWYFTLQMKEFLSSIREDRSPLSDGRDVRRVLPILEAADRSAERHELIYLG
jgi:predicted dehydrogenase